MKCPEPDFEDGAVADDQLLQSESPEMVAGNLPASVTHLSAI
jgi:hypothetical protein